MTKPRIQLIGEDGNAFAILGRCQKAARKAGWSKDAIEAFMEEAKSGDYDHLLRTVMEHFAVDEVESEAGDSPVSKNLDYEPQNRGWLRDEFYRQAVEEAKADPIVQAMAKDLREGGVQTDALSWAFIRGCNVEYERRGGTLQPRAIGTVAEAIQALNAANGEEVAHG